MDVSSTGGAAVTSTVSVASPIVSEGLKVRDSESIDNEVLLFSVLNPFASIRSEYVPGGSGAMV